jgi:hypothetical protein
MAVAEPIRLSVVINDGLVNFVGRPAPVEFLENELYQIAW